MINDDVDEKTNAALSGQKLWVIMCSEEKRNPLFLFRLNALLCVYLT
ncbi:hypothetical protein PTRA_a1926 [Pseudoalteromonas translucida KMM 520]|uniref:Uncharacterized protein n=1 Tax=Pseudoalteromonas translucida KMM 520 TaxID=1315283 RepID=A0A0U2WIG3_9GAMM|nr:hypothetical protein PTRA_a1926 [Pseudoalteromonas translucida KMM 520]